MVNIGAIFGRGGNRVLLSSRLDFSAFLGTISGNNDNIT